MALLFRYRPLLRFAAVAASLVVLLSASAAYAASASCYEVSNNETLPQSGSTQFGTSQYMFNPYGNGQYDWYPSLYSMCMQETLAVGQSIHCAWNYNGQYAVTGPTGPAGSAGGTAYAYYAPTSVNYISDPYTCYTTDMGGGFTQYTCSGGDTYNCSYTGTPPTASASISPSTINSGQSATVSWSSSNATSCTGTNFSTGGSTSGSRSVSPSSSTTYYVTCSGSGGSVNSNAVTLNVNQCASGYGNSCTATNSCGQSNTGTIQCNGSCSATAPSLPSGYGNSCQSSANACGQKNTGTIQCNGQCSASTPSNSQCPAPGASLSASPSTIDSGSAVTLTYKCTNSSSGSINNNVGSITADGSSHTKSVSPGSSTTYTLTCNGYNGSNASANAGVSVNPALSASCSVSPTAIYLNNSATWTASPSGGTGSYSYSWSGTDSLSGTTKSVTKTYSSSGTKTGKVTVNDGLSSKSSSCSNSVTVASTVANLKPISFSATSAQAGTPTTFTAVVQDNGTADTPTFGSTVYVCPASDSACQSSYLSMNWFQKFLAWLFPSAYAGTSIKISTNRISIAAGQSGTQTASYTFAAGGTDVMMFCADTPLHEVSVSNPSDECTAWQPLAVANAPLAATCSVSPSSGYTGDTFTWTAAPTGGTGSYSYSWSGTDGLSGTTQSVQKSYGALGTKTGSVTVTSGSEQVSPTCSNTATVAQGPTATLSASPSSYVTGQGPATLIWSSQNASSCTGTNFSTGGALSGSVQVNPSTTTTYSISCSNGTHNGVAATTLTIVDVAEDISANPTTVRNGDSSTITWSATGAPDSCSVTGPGLSSTALSGSQAVPISSQSTFTIACLSQGTTVSKSVTVSIVPYYIEY